MSLRNSAKLAKVVAAAVVAVAAAGGTVANTVHAQPPADCYQTIQVA